MVDYSYYCTLNSLVNLTESRDSELLATSQVGGSCCAMN